MITIKKLSFLFITLLIFSMVACVSQENSKKTKSISLSIETDLDIYELYTSSARGITLTPKVEGISDEDIQYHWTIDSDTETLYTEDGPNKEIINSGESVVFTPIAEISYSEPGKLSNTIKINLRIEEKQSNNVLAERDLIIEDYSGTYKVKI